MGDTVITKQMRAHFSCSGHTAAVELRESVLCRLPKGETYLELPRCNVARLPSVKSAKRVLDLLLLIRRNSAARGLLWALGEPWPTPHASMGGRCFLHIKGQVSLSWTAPHCRIESKELCCFVVTDARACAKGLCNLQERRSLTTLKLLCHMGSNG